MRDLCIPVVVGDRVVMEEAVRLPGLSVKLNIIRTPEEARHTPGTIDMIDLATLSSFKKKMPTAEGGRASAAYIRKAVELAVNKQVDAMVTAPISKEALKMAGMNWPGHTEMIAELTGTKDYAMMLAGGPLRVILVTIHTALRNVPDLITKEISAQDNTPCQKGLQHAGNKRPADRCGRT